jgi:integrase
VCQIIRTSMCQIISKTTCAKLCRKNGGDLEQIKFVLGHSSIQTTERYLGSEQDIEIAVDDNLGL